MSTPLSDEELEAIIAKGDCTCECSACERRSAFSMAVELRTARETLSKLPLTADGKPIVPGMMLYPAWDNELEDEQGGLVLRYAGVVLRDSVPHKSCEIQLDDEEVAGCYSTREAALAARQANTHVCGLTGFNGMIDKCPGCEAARQVVDAEGKGAGK